VTNKLALVVAVVLGFLSIVLIRRYVENIEQRHRFDLVPKPALVAARDIAPGTVITENDIDTVEFPGKLLDQAFKDSRIPIESKGTIVNARTVFEIKAGQVFQRYHFPDIGVGRRNDLKGKFGREYRAFTIPIDPVRGVAGMLRPSDYVDIISTIQFTDLSGSSTTATRTVLRKVLILAVDDKLNPEDVRPGTTYSSLTLRLTPKDCNRLMFVMSKGGSLQCTYVQEGSGEEAGWDTVTAETLYDEVSRELEALQRRGG
jgi:pilus assembly protein CpaB